MTMALPPSPSLAPTAVDDALTAAQSAVARGDLASAVRIAETALARGVRHPHLYNLLAYGLEEAGRLGDSFRVLQHALEMAPQDPQILHAMGLCLFKMGRTVESLVAFDAALLHRPDFAPILHHKGLAHHALGAAAEASAAFEAAAAVDANYADPWAGLAVLAYQRGDYGAARRHAGEALQRDKHIPGAHIAMAQADLAEGAVDQAEARIRALLKSRALPASDRADVLSLLGDILDVEGRCAEAFAAYGEAKAAAEGANSALLVGATDYPKLAALASETLNAWGAKGRLAPATAPAAPAPDAKRPERHVFLLGFPRSGTTLLEQVLQSHPGIVSLDERATLEGLATDYLSTAEGYRRLLALEGEALERARQRYWTILSEGGVDPSGPAFVDKLPLNTLKLPLIARLFPDAHILFCIRDPRDVVFSCFRRAFQMNGGMREFVSVERAARFYDAVMRAGEAARSVLPLKLHEVRYEAFVADLKGEASAVCGFLGLEWDEAMLDFAAGARQRAILTPSAAQVRKGLYQDGVGQWRRYRKEMAPALEILEPWVRRFGYVDPA